MSEDMHDERSGQRSRYWKAKQSKTNNTLAAYCLSGFCTERKKIVNLDTVFCPQCSQALFWHRGVLVTTSNHRSEKNANRINQV